MCELDSSDLLKGRILSGIVASQRQRQRILDWALPFLDAGERLEFASFAQVGQVTAKAAAKEFGRSLVVAAVTLGTFSTVPRARMMSVAVTDRRLLFFDRAPTQFLGKPPKPAIVLLRAGFDRSPVKRIGFAQRFTIQQTGTPDALRLQFNLGWSKDAAAVAAVFGQALATATGVSTSM